jgi:hypothetical protein
MEFFSSVSPPRMEKTSYSTSMKESMDLMPVGELWSEKPFDKVIFCQQLFKTLVIWYKGVKLVNFTANTLGCQLKHFRLSFSPSHSRVGGLTSSSLSLEDEVAIGSCMWPSTNSQSGLRQSQQGR